MTVTLVSRANGRTFKLSPRVFGKLLHLARFNGWLPEQIPHEWPSKSWGTEIILPHVGHYMPGTVSKEDAAGLLRALIRANATGEVALDGSLHFASQALLQMARDGSFEVRLDPCHAFSPHALAGVPSR
jgi:hypothetical protein